MEFDLEKIVEMMHENEVNNNGNYIKRT